MQEAGCHTAFAFLVSLSYLIPTYGQTDNVEQAALPDVATKHSPKAVNYWPRGQPIVLPVAFNTAFAGNEFRSSDKSDLREDFDTKSSSFLTKKIPTKLRQALVLTLESETIPPFIEQCMKKSRCTQNDVIHGIGGKAWVYRVRHRRAIMYFWHVYECVVYNRPESCPVDGHWSKWSAWGSCSVSCGHGFRKRKRRCDHPAPLNYGKFCSGVVKERERCSKDCPKNFTELAGQDPLKLQALKTLRATERSYPAINETCSKDRCTFHEVLHLIGDDSAANQYWLAMHCIERYIGCLVDGEWSAWQPWTSCTSECGIGDRFRLRRCNDPPPSNGGQPCEGEMYEREDCLGVTCGGAGGNASAIAQFPLWSEWSDWTRCASKNCLVYGTEYSKRTCVGLTANSVCNVGDNSMKSSLLRKRPCVKEGCVPHKKKVMPVTNKTAVIPARPSVKSLSDVHPPAAREKSRLLPKIYPKTPSLAATLRPGTRKPKFGPPSVYDAAWNGVPHRLIRDLKNGPIQRSLYNQLDSSVN